MCILGVKRVPIKHTLGLGSSIYHIATWTLWATGVT